MAPIYVAAGFALYITRRIKLEGWDIELGFKRMKNRLENSTANIRSNNNSSNIVLACIPLLISLFLNPFFSSFSYAQSTHNPNKEDAKSTIEKVLKHEDFGETITKNEWVFVGGSTQDEDEEKKMPQWLKDFLKWLFGSIFEDDENVSLKILEILIWLALAVFIVWLINKYSHWLNWINLPSRENKHKARSIPNKILGMDMAQESLPDDVLAVFTSLINNKKYRDALSLLYRASLSTIVHRGDIEIPTSATEQECCKIITSKRDPSESKFFKSLTHAWIMLAYADHEPSKETLTGLQEGWNKHYVINQTPDHS